MKDSFSTFTFISKLLLTFTVVLSHPVGAVDVHDTHQLTSDQLVFGWALQGDDCAHSRAISLDDPLGAQCWQGHG